MGPGNIEANLGGEKKLYESTVVQYHVYCDDLKFIVLVLVP